MPEPKNLAAEADAMGWQSAFYDFSISRISKNLPIPEDKRTADWTYLVSLTDQASALIIGCGWGEVPITLSKRCRLVTVTDFRPEMVDFLKIRQKQQQIENLDVHLLSENWILPFSNDSFDFVCVNSPSGNGDPIPFAIVARKVAQLLKKDGSAFFSVGNRWSAAFSSSRTANNRLSRHTFFGYRSILKKCGFANIQAYAPLPYYDGIPLMNLPLDEPRAMRFFFRNIFPLFEMVSPESKRAYAMEYAVARTGVRLMRLLRLESVSKYFFTGYNFLATKSPIPC